MEEAKHTPGLLKAFNLYADPEIRDSEEQFVANVGGRGNHQAVANARRLAACWNACIGISTENLEQNLPVQELAKRYNAALAQRDTLLNELHRALPFVEDLENDDGYKPGYVRDAIQKIRAAIKSATGGQ